MIKERMSMETDQVVDNILAISVLMEVLQAEVAHPFIGIRAQDPKRSTSARLSSLSFLK